MLIKNKKLSEISNINGDKCKNGYVKFNCNTSNEQNYLQCAGLDKYNKNNPGDEHSDSAAFLRELNEGIFESFNTGSWQLDAKFENGITTQGPDTVGLRWFQGTKEGCGKIFFDNGIKSPIVIILESSNFYNAYAYYIDCPKDDNPLSGCYSTEGLSQLNKELSSMYVYSSKNLCENRKNKGQSRSDCFISGKINVKYDIDKRSCDTDDMTYNDGKRFKACVGSFEGNGDRDMDIDLLYQDNTINSIEKFNNLNSKVYLYDILKLGYFCGITEWKKVYSGYDEKLNILGFQIDTVNKYSGTWVIDTPTNKDFVISFKSDKYWAAYYIPAGRAIKRGKWTTKFASDNKKSSKKLGTLTRVTLWIKNDI